MAVETEIKIPDIGGASGVDVIEVLVKEGDVIEKDAPLLTLETDKASMEIPSPFAGVVRSIKLKRLHPFSPSRSHSNNPIESQCERTL